MEMLRQLPKAKGYDRRNSIRGIFLCPACKKEVERTTYKGRAAKTCSRKCGHIIRDKFRWGSREGRVRHNDHTYTNSELQAVVDDMEKRKIVDIEAWGNQLAGKALTNEEKRKLTLEKKRQYERDYRKFMKQKKEKQKDREAFNNLLKEETLRNA